MGDRTAWVLLASRKVNKRTALFAEGLCQRGYAVKLIALPRLPWDLSALEGNHRVVVQPFNVGIGGKGRLLPHLVLAMHWGLLPAALMLRLIGSKAFYDECDDYALTALEGNWFSRAVTPWLVNVIHRLMLPMVQGVFCIRMADGALARSLLGFGTEAIEVHNYPTRRWIRIGPPPPAGLKLVYTGALWDVKGGSMLTKLASSPRLQECGIELHVFGGGDRQVLDELARLPGTIVHGARRTDEIIAFLHAHRCVGLALYQDTPRYRLIGTNSHKIFEYLAAGAPVISTPIGEIPDYVTASNGRLVAADVSVEALVRTIVEFQEHPETWEALSRAAVDEMLAHRRLWEEEWLKIAVVLERHAC